MMVRFYSYFLILSFCTSFYVGSYILADSKNNLLNDDFWDTTEIQAPHHGLDSNQKYQSDLSNFESENQTPKVDTLAEGEEKKRKWSSILTFDRLKNVTEKDKGPCNDTKVIFMNLEDRLTIYENDDDEDEIDLQDRGPQRFSLLSPHGFLSRIHSGEEKSLERTKRQAENGKRKCRCRRKGRRVMRRRRRRRRRGRRRRVGQTRPARRRRRGRRRGAGRRRGRRRCVCRKKNGDEGEGEGDGEGDGGDGEEEAEGKGDEDAEEGEETTTTEGEEESDNDEEGEEGNDEEEEEEEEGEEEEEDEDSEDDEDPANESNIDEKGGSEDESGKNEVPLVATNRETPVYVIYPGASGAYGPAPNAGGGPTYTNLPIPFSPYPYYAGSHSTTYRKP